MSGTPQELDLCAVKASSVNRDMHALFGVQNVLADDGKYWRSRDPSGEEWLLFDAGGPVTVSRVDLRHGCGGPQNWAKDCSLDVAASEEGPWERAFSVSTAAKMMHWQSFHGLGGRGQFWKFCLHNKHRQGGGQFSMSVQNVRFFGATDPLVLTLHVALGVEPPLISASCTSMAGDELATACDLDPALPLCDVRVLLAAQISEEPERLSLLLPDGRVLGEQDLLQPLSAYLVDVDSDDVI